MTELFRFEQVRIERDDHPVLDGIDVSIPADGITAVVGASGSGKSTLLRCCNLLESPTSGRITFRGVDLAGVEPRAHRRRVAMVFQSPTVFAGTGLDNLRAADPEIGDEAAGRLLERVGLPTRLLTREADTLSGGEAQRLCLARALATDPEVILADESTSALDRASTVVLEDLARTLADEGLPVLWVSHDQGQVRRIARRVIELDHGRVVHTGPTERTATAENPDDER